jgi:type I restriction enzyme S subunit
MTKLPDTWRWSTLGEQCDLYQPKTISREKMMTDGSYEVYGANGVIGMYNEYNHEESEVLLSCRGNCGTVNVSKPKSWINGNAMVCRPKTSALLKSYLRYYLESVNFAKVITGTAQQQITREPLSKVEIAIPPIYEQRKIVELLEDHLSRLDAALDDVRQAKILASQFRASVLNYVFFDSGTKGWTPYKAADLGKWITGSTPSSKVQDFIGEDVPFITPGDILDGGEIINYSRMISNLGADAVRRLRSNSVHLVCIGATLGKVGIVRFETTSNQQINALEANEEIVLPDFVMWLLATPSMQRKLWEASSSTTVPILNKGNLEKIELRVPDLNGQRKALEEFDRAKLTYEHLKKDFESILDKSNRLRRSILQAAFTGQLTKEVESV